MDTSLILLGLFYLLAPAIILYLTKKSSIVKKLGSIVVAYGIGIAMSLLGFLPEGSAQIQNIMTSASVPIAIPLLLFPTKIKEWFSLAGPTFKALIVGLFSVVIMVFIGFFLFKPEEGEGFWKVGALLIGVYTGGTPNLASLNHSGDSLTPANDSQSAWYSAQAATATKAATIKRKTFIFTSSST